MQLLKKWLLASLVLGGTALAGYAQAPATWRWATKGGSAGVDDYCRGVALDERGAVWITGDFKNSFSLAGTPVQAAGGADTYVARLRPNGSAQMVRTFGGLGPEVGVDLDTYGPECAAYITGTYFGPLTLNPGVSLPAPRGQRDVYVTQFDSLGRAVWASTFGSRGSDSGNEVVTSATGEVWATGIFAGDSIQFPDGSRVAKAGGPDDVWVSNHSRTGRFRRGFTLPGTGHEEGRGISVDATGHVLLSGEFDATVQVGGATLTSRGGSDIYLVRYDSLGQVQFYKHWGGAGLDHARGVDADAAGNVYVSGVFTGSVSFDGTVLTSVAGSKDVFVAKLTPTGTLLWVRQIGGPSPVDEGAELEVSATTGNMVLTPNVGAVTTLPNGTVVTGNAQNQLVLKLNSSGQVLWHKLVPGTGGQVINFAVGLDSRENVAVAGSFTGNMTFDALPLAGEPQPTTPGGPLVGDFYVAYLPASAGVLAVAPTTDQRAATFYPNPVAATLHLLTPAGLERATLRDSQGRQVRDWRRPAAALDVADVRPGYYLLRLELLGGAVVHQPLLKQ